MIVHSTDFKTNLGKYLDMLEEEDIYILRNGQPVGKLTQYTMLTDLDLLKENANAYNYNHKEISYTEFIQRYEETDERLEYIDGRVYALSSPTHTHQSIIGFLFNIFYTYFKGKTCQPFFAPYDVHFETSDYKACVQPDIFVMCDKENVIDEKYYGTPTLVVEVLSPASRTKDMLTKLNLYWREGVCEYLIVDPQNKVIHYWCFKDKEVIMQKEFNNKDTFKSNFFEGLKIDLSEMFK